MSDPVVWPVEIRLAKDRHSLTITFDDGARFDLSAELLRVTSPSAEVQGHSEAERKTVGGKRNVTIFSVDPTSGRRSGRRKGPGRETRPDPDGYEPAGD